MTQDPHYAPVPLVYKSRGLIARYAQDQCPPETYLQMMNCLERTEDTVSSRYGTRIVNRDAEGVGTLNHFFPAPITSLARLTYVGQSYRYAGLGDGSLLRRSGDTPGAFTPIYAGLSGQPFGSLVTSCFQSSQPYQFIYDADVSLKDNGLGTPQLTGIDPSPYTLNTTPYSPLLTLIDNFDPGNAYTAAGFTAGWNYAPLLTLTSTGGQRVTDFPEFLGINQLGAGSFAIAGGTTTAAVLGVGVASDSSTYSGFPATPITGSEAVSLSVTLLGTVSNGIHATGAGSITLSYSTDGGATFTPFFSRTAVPGTADLGGTVSIAVPGLANLASLQIRTDTSINTLAGSTGTTATSAVLSNLVAVVTNPNVFGPITNGMLALLGTTASIATPIVQVVSSNLAGGTWRELTVTTSSAHGYAPGSPVSLYASSNDLVDGFYSVLATPSPNSFTVALASNVPLSSSGGTTYGRAATPASCVLANQYSTPYPTQMSAWGFYQPVPLATTQFPVSAWSGSVAANSVATVGVTVNLNLSMNHQVTDDDLIVLTIQVGNPAAIASIRLQFDVAGSGYSSSYYYKDLSPAYYQGNVQQTESSYLSTEQQIFADTLGLISGQPPNSTAAQLQPGNLSTGQGTWVAVYLRRGDFVPIGSAGQSGLDWNSITGWQLVATTNTVGESTVGVNGIYLQWGYGPSSFGGVGYDYRQTYFNAATGTESNGCPPQKFDSQFGYLASLAAPFFLRQAVRVLGQYSTDPQVTHVRLYRRGGIYASNWFLIDQFPNLAQVGQFAYKDVIPDAVLAQAPPLVLDNDPPVTSTLRTPIATTLALQTVPPGTDLYALFTPQQIFVVDPTAGFVPNQVVDLGYATNLEQVRVITGGVGSFTAIVRLLHNAGEPVNVYSIPRQPCNQCALAYDQVWLGGDPNNPNWLYYSKRNRPESFGPQNRLPVGGSDETITAVVNWRGNLFVSTDHQWYSIFGGASPHAQPTGSAHGCVARQGWIPAESAIFYRAADGWREFSGANGQYVSLAVELIYRPNPTPPLTPVPLADPAQAAQDIVAFYNNSVYASYVSTTNAGQRFRLSYDVNYRRFRSDDVPATAMLWEPETNTFLVGQRLAAGPNAGAYVLVEDQVGDYDDGGWSAGFLAQIPIALTLQTPYGDLGKPHFPKQYNSLETDVNPQGQAMHTTLRFDTEPPLTLVLPAQSSAGREKLQAQVNAGLGQQAYSMSIEHSMAVLVAPSFYQENIYAAPLAAFRSSFDTYWLEFGDAASKLVKQAYFDYTSPDPIPVSLYADGSPLPYFSFTLPANPGRRNLPMRVRFPARKLRQFRAVGVSAGAYQFWNNPVLHWKAIKVGTGYANYEFTT